MEQNQQVAPHVSRLAAVSQILPDLFHSADCQMSFQMQGFTPRGPVGGAAKV